MRLEIRSATASGFRWRRRAGDLTIPQDIGIPYKLTNRSAPWRNHTLRRFLGWLSFWGGRWNRNWVKSVTVMSLPTRDARLDFSGQQLLMPTSLPPTDDCRPFSFEEAKGGARPRTTLLWALTIGLVFVLSLALLVRLELEAMPCTTQFCLSQSN